MHTDEYEISLSREVKVCEKSISKIKKILDLLERKHGMTTAAFIEKRRNGTLPESPDLIADAQAWESGCESLRSWEELEKEYHEAYKMMRKE